MDWGGRSSMGRDRFDIVGNLLLLPKFSERDLETFFSLFEHWQQSYGPWVSARWGDDVTSRLDRGRCLPIGSLVVACP